MTNRELKKFGYRVVRGSYLGTADDRYDRWYIERLDGPVDRRGAGYRTRREAVEALFEYLRGQYP